MTTAEREAAHYKRAVADADRKCRHITKHIIRIMEENNLYAKAFPFIVFIKTNAFVDLLLFACDFV